MWIIRIKHFWNIENRQYLPLDWGSFEITLPVSLRCISASTRIQLIRSEKEGLIPRREAYINLFYLTLEENLPKKRKEFRKDLIFFL